MNKTTFNKIKETLETRILNCSIFLDRISTTEDLKKLTLDQAQQLQRFCRAEEAIQTKIVQCDLYHIIGMGNLTAPQMTKLSYLIKEYLQYRPTLKTLAGHLDKISSLPSIPVSGVYKAHGFDGLVLCSGIDVETNAKALSDVPYAICGNLIQVLPEKANEFIDFWIQKSKTNLSIENFLAKAAAGSEYGGVRWTVDHLGIYIGVIQSDNIKQMFEDFLK